LAAESTIPTPANCPVRFAVFLIGSDRAVSDPEPNAPVKSGAFTRKASVWARCSSFLFYAVEKNGRDVIEFQQIFIATTPRPLAVSQEVFPGLD
jgi:hypothetical protein